MYLFWPSGLSRALERSCGCWRRSQTLSRRQSSHASRGNNEYYADLADGESDEDLNIPAVGQDSSIITDDQGRKNLFVEPKNDDTAFLGSNLNLVESCEPQSDLVRRSMAIVSEQKKAKGSQSLIDKRMATLAAFEQSQHQTDDAYNPIVSDKIGLVN